MESYITLSFLNDFIFCPRSIYFHQLYSGLNYELYKQKPQIAGEAAHSNIDNKNYSTRKNILQDIEVFSFTTRFIIKTIRFRFLKMI
jgi:CRISPR-associated protein Cas4